MRRPWIKVETTTPDKPEVCAIATTLRLDQDAVLGKLIRLWSWVELNRVSINDLGVTKAFIDKLTGRKGFASALMAVGWLVEGEGKLRLNNLERHNGNSAKVRALTAQRVALHRKRKVLTPDVFVSKSLHNEVKKGATTASEEGVLNDIINNKIKDNGLIYNEKCKNLTSSSDASNVTIKSDSLASEVKSHSIIESAVKGSHLEEGDDLMGVETTRKRSSKPSTESPEQPTLF